MAKTAHRSKLELDPNIAALADAVSDETSIEARAAGHSLSADDVDELALAREEKIALIIKEHQVPKAIAIIMCDTGYSKGTANRIFNDRCKRERIAREAAASAQQAKSARQPGNTASVA